MYRSETSNILPILLLCASAVSCRSVRYFGDPDGTSGDTADSAGSDSTDTADTLSDDGGTDTESDAPCGNTLASRLVVTKIETGINVRSVESGYDHTPVPASVALDLRADGTGYVAWIEEALSAVYVTPLNAGLERDGDDLEVEGHALGGFTTVSDGFALLTRRDDEGEDIAADEEDRPVQAVVLVRGGDSAELSSSVLTGTEGVDGASDYNNVENFRTSLRWDGERFAAYFEIRGDTGFFGDKLVFVDENGTGEVPWSFVCGIVRDVDIVVGDGEVYPLCMSDRSPTRGFNLMFEDGIYRQISQEYADNGYSGGALGGVVRMSDGTYVAAWSSRRRRWVDSVEVVEDAHDIALLRMTSELEPIGTVKWVTETSDIDEVNLHIAPYGSDRILLSWNTVTDFRVRGETCFGTFGGTLFQTLTPDGLALTPDGLVLSEPETLPAPMTWGTRPFVYPNGDVAWAFVDDTPDYSVPTEMLATEEHRSIYIARLKYCEIGTSLL